MDHIVTEMVEHISRSHEHMARVLEAKRHVAVRMAQMVHALPDSHPDFGTGMEGLMESSLAVTQSVVSYLNSIAELQETIAATVGSVMKEIGQPERDDE